MPKNLTTTTVDAEVYEGLHRVIGSKRISQFQNDLARLRVVSRVRRDGSRRNQGKPGLGAALVADLHNEPQRD